MARKRRTVDPIGYAPFASFEAMFREVFRRAERGAGAEARRFFNQLLGGAAIPLDGEPLPESIPEPYRVLGVLPDAPRFVVEAAYRSWAKALHPDRHGEGARDFERGTGMAEVNAAMAAVRKARGWK